MYADDTFLSKEVRNDLEIRQEIIPELLKIYDWLKADKLSLNILKTEFMITGNPRRFGNLSKILVIRVETKLIKSVKMTKCLGNITDQHLTWEDHIEYVSKKIRRNIGVLKRLRNVIPRDSLITLYKTVLGQNPPGKPPGQNPPDKIPLDKIPPRTKSPGQNPPIISQKTAPLLNTFCFI